MASGSNLWAGDDADGASAPFTPPKYQFLRQNEDWSGLAGAAGSGDDFWDALKYLPLNDDGSIWASFGGHWRERWEDWSNFNFGAPPGADHSDGFLLSRVAIHGDVHVGENLRVFAEGKSALSTDRNLPGGRRTLDVDTLALQQLFVDWTLPLDADASLTLRPGRQMLQFGRQRLVSPLPWGNSLRTWDGVSAILHSENWTVSGFWTQFVPVQKYDFNDPDAQTEFFGVNASGKDAVADLDLELYFYGLNKEDPVMFNGTEGPEDRYTAGGRVNGELADTGFEIDLEGAYQFGEVGAGDIQAYMVAAELAHRLEGAPFSPRVWVGFDYASGDDSPGGDVGTFNQLFPLGHAYFGFIDTVGRQNVIDWSTGLSVQPSKKATVGLAGHLFYLADDADALYNAGGAAIRPGGVSDSHEVGAEIDLTLQYQFDRHLTGVFGYSHFFPGTMLKDSGPAQDVDFFYLMAQYTF